MHHQKRSLRQRVQLVVSLPPPGRGQSCWIQTAAQVRVLNSNPSPESLPPCQSDPPGRSPSPPLSSLTGNPPEETLYGSGPRAINPWCSGGISQRLAGKGEV